MHDLNFSLPQPNSPGMNHSLFIMVLKEMVSMESNWPVGAAPVASPSYPCSLQIRIVYFVFLHDPVAKSPEKGGYI
jgi:hypothetical protein